MSCRPLLEHTKGTSFARIQYLPGEGVPATAEGGQFYFGDPPLNGPVLNRC